MVDFTAKTFWMVESGLASRAPNSVETRKFDFEGVQRWEYLVQDHCSTQGGHGVLGALCDG